MWWRWPDFDDDGGDIISDDGDYDSLISVRIFQQLLLKRWEGQWSQSRYFVTQQIANKLLSNNWYIQIGKLQITRAFDAVWKLISALSDPEKLSKQSWWWILKFSWISQISYLDNFDDKEEGEGKGGEDKNQSAQGEQVRK